MSQNDRDRWANVLTLTDHAWMWLKKTTYNRVHMCLVFEKIIHLYMTKVCSEFLVTFKVNSSVQSCIQ